MENEILENNNEVLENVVVQEDVTSVELNQIHEDLGAITSFLVFFSVVIIAKYAYEFFNMIFKY